jgi:glycosyltransferase involved in cell wall biosynthesis
MISVIIPAHNAAQTLAACLEALIRQTSVDVAYEIIVIDDGSTDNTRYLAESAGVRVIRQEKRGPASARNAGILAAAGEIVCFTDADCVPEPNWLKQITASLFAKTEIAGCKGTYCTDQRERVARFVQLEYEEKYNRLRRHPRIMFIDFYSAAFRRHILIENDGFDERFTRANSEDRELSYRLAARGYHMVFQPLAVVRHRHSNSVSQALRHFPQRGIEDSYTPHLLKAQIGLMACILAAIVATLVNLVVGVFLVGFLAIFLLTTLPFVRNAWSRDLEVALMAPFMLMLRAIALGMGFGWGLVHPLKQTTMNRSWGAGRGA